MTDTTEPVPAHAMFKVLAALADLGEATAAAVADTAGLGYSTATAKLRAWESTGKAERVHTDSKVAVWRLTADGVATVGAHQNPPPQPATSAPTSEQPTNPPQEENADGPPTVASQTPTAGGAADASTSAAEEDSSDTADVHGHAMAAADDQTDPPPAAQPERDAPTADEPEREGPTADEPERDAPAADEPVTDAKSRRSKGSLAGAVLDVLEAHPDRAYKVSELCKLIDAANAGTDAKKASAGAVVNAADKLVNQGKAVRTVERPATFQLAPAEQ
ncbi:MarR family transcriptional regulator [Micromonospora craniellae]|uniref:MarR family transcriptional regulator n=1 Tax=Micromonospora craniellae TaxID=2294034 RepID=A0A372FTB0_9ACTN|nr:MarR family transcriptional regulator [Micromonospora craniellae]QOC94378.1 MarR family transcriptional regulator [Micromonospora craniellae]RFS43750.1 MarR family transcriptional regulator [Micromonospora craniellae]